MIRSMIYTPEKGLEHEVALETVSDLIERETNLVWLDVDGPTEADILILKEEFGFHDLALEDALTEDQRSKVDQYEGYLFLVIHWVSENKSRELEAHQLSVFVGPNYMVTIRRAPLPAIAESIRRVVQRPDLMKMGVGFLVYFVMDSIVDSYFPIMDKLEDRLDDMQDCIFSQKDGYSPEDSLNLKRDLLTVRKVVGPLRDALNVLTRQDQQVFSTQSLAYFQDIYDHLVRIYDMIDTNRDMLTSTMDAYLTVVSNRLNGIMKTLTIVATVAMPMTVITGLYGMNFKYMPELSHPYGYPMAVATMVLMGLAMAAWFKRMKWF